MKLVARNLIRLPPPSTQTSLLDAHEAVLARRSVIEPAHVDHGALGRVRSPGIGTGTCRRRGRPATRPATAIAATKDITARFRVFMVRQLLSSFEAGESSLSPKYCGELEVSTRSELMRQGRFPAWSAVASLVIRRFGSHHAVQPIHDGHKHVNKNVGVLRFGNLQGSLWTSNKRAA